MEVSDGSRTFVLGAVAGLGVALMARAVVAVVATYLSAAVPPQPLQLPIILTNGKDQHLDLEDDILSEQFTRNTQFFGEEAQRKIMGSYVVVVGLGGVGSHAAHLLLRSGVSHLKLIDFDQVGHPFEKRRSTSSSPSSVATEPLT